MADQVMSDPTAVGRWRRFWWFWCGARKVDWWAHRIMDLLGDRRMGGGGAVPCNWLRTDFGHPDDDGKPLFTAWVSDDASSLALGYRNSDRCMVMFHRGRELRPLFWFIVVRWWIIGEWFGLRRWLWYRALFIVCRRYHPRQPQGAEWERATTGGSR